MADADDRSSITADLTPDAAPSDRRRQRVRDLILEAAQALFAEHGEQGLTIRGIADKIDYSPGAIYQYFRSKEEILAAIRDVFFARLLQRLDEVTDGREMSVACMLDGLRAYIECGLELPNHYRMAFAGGEPEPITTESKVYEAAQRLQNMIADAVEHGVTSPVNALLAAKAVWPCLHGVTLLLVDHVEFPSGMPGSEHMSREDVIEFHIALLVRGLGADLDWPPEGAAASPSGAPSTE